MSFKGNTYNQHLCITLTEGAFLADFKEYMQWIYFQQFLVAADEAALVALKSKTDALNDICQVIEEEAYNARANS